MWCMHTREHEKPPRLKSGEPGLRKRKGEWTRKFGHVLDIRLYSLLVKILHLITMKCALLRRHGICDSNSNHLCVMEYSLINGDPFLRARYAFEMIVSALLLTSCPGVRAPFVFLLECLACSSPSHRRSRQRWNFGTSITLAYTQNGNHIFYARSCHHRNLHRVGNQSSRHELEIRRLRIICITLTRVATRYISILPSHLRRRIESAPENLYSTFDGPSPDHVDRIINSELASSSRAPTRILRSIPSQWRSTSTGRRSSPTRIASATCSPAH
jgi:hypothetical protein